MNGHHSPGNAIQVVPVASLDWPPPIGDDAAPLPTACILCAGDAFLDHELRRMELRDLRHGSSFYDATATADADAENETEEALQDASLSRDLFALSHEQLEELTYYQVLGDMPMHSNSEQVKRAYRKACLTYHPDKTGRGEQDEVFLKVKAAFETLGDVSKRKAYDSSVDFDESIPKGDEQGDQFYAAYGPVFERNLRFDARNDPERNGNKSVSSVKKSRRRSNGSFSYAQGPPAFGDDTTPMDQVHAFYEYWIHFESWRDFTLEATKQLKDYDVESADSRYEKRYYAKEIDKKAKALKREEMARINLLVERAMAADPRLNRERLREREEKERLAAERKEREEVLKKRQKDEAERVATEKAKREEQERKAKAVVKAEKEKEKKQLRKARQLLRKMAVTAFQEAGSDARWSNLEALNDDVELLCTKMSALQITELTDAFGGSDSADSPNIAALDNLERCVTWTKAGMSEAERKAEQQRDAARKADAEKARKKQTAKAMKPWNKEELSALAKAVRKYPSGGANRWDTIALFVNNLCKPEEPRTKEECIEKFNQISRSNAPSVAKQSSLVSESSDSVGAATWTDEQDKQLQIGLAKYPATMDKNERWTSIAKQVDGKTKKECVQRFKAIREAIKNK